MAIAIIMPKMGMTNREGTVERWHKSEGDPVTQGEEIAEISSDKVVTNIEAKSSGILRCILCKEEEVVRVGQTIGIIGTADEDISAFLTNQHEPPEEHTEPGPNIHEEESAPLKPEEVKVVASPLARKLAADHGIDLATIRGTGPSGRITQQDVLNAVASFK
jgi:pyruvate dehydrogenase E2 component (dihydrolipoamide acetyltransferase)